MCSDKQPPSGCAPAPVHKDNIVCLTWNIEGYSRSSLEIRQLADAYSPDLILLSEPWLFQCDSQLVTQLLNPQYKMLLNSDDVYDPELPLLHSNTSGGTMLMWTIENDPYVTVVPVDSTSFLPMVFSPPGHAPSIHIAVYLPTHGQENEFMSELANLSLSIDQLRLQHPEAVCYLRGDFNVSDKNKNRSSLLNHLCQEQELSTTRHITTSQAMVCLTPTLTNFCFLLASSLLNIL